MNDIEKRAEIALCPFCSDWGAEVAESAVPSIHGGQKQAVYCNTCFCEEPTSETEKGAVEAWNRRAALTPPEDPVAEVAKRLIGRFMIECNAVGAYEAGYGLARSLKREMPALLAARPEVP